MNNRDLRSLTEAYEQVFLKENELDDMSRQDPREGFPPHEQDRYENEEDVIGSVDSDDTEKYEAAERLAQEIMADHSIFNDESLEDNEDCESAIQDILNFAKQRISELNDEITAKGDVAADQYEEELGESTSVMVKEDDEYSEEDDEYSDEEDEDRDEPYDMSDVEADADTLSSAGYGTDEDYGGYEESLSDCYNRLLMQESKKSVNPWAVENALEKKTGKHFSKEKKEKIIKGIKKGAKKYGKKITSKAVKKK